jgi:chromosome segregation ATPase
MLLKHLLEDLARLATSAHPYAETNITGVELQDMDVIFDYDPYELDCIKETLKEHEETIKDLEKEVEDKNKELDDKDIDLTNLIGIVDSIKDLLEENKALKKTDLELRKGLHDWEDFFDKQEKTIQTLRARKNTAKVMERDAKSGRLVAEYQGKKYILEEIK